MSTDGTGIDSVSGETLIDHRPRIALRPHHALPWLMLPEGLPLQMLMDVVPVRVPNTRPWFHGVLSQRGNLMPVFDLGQWAGLAPIDRHRSHLVAVGQGTHACALVCVTAPSLITIHGPASEQSDNGALAPYLSAASASGYGPVYGFDANRWLADVSLHVASATTLTATH